MGDFLTRRKIAVFVGILFFVQLITFLIGNIFVQQFVAGDAGRATLAAGVALEIVAGIAVVTIGFLMYRVLRAVHQKLASLYPAMRVTEFTVSVILATYLLIQLEEFPNHLLWVYIPTAIGGLVLNYLLWISRLVPRAISGMGFVGYALLLLIVPLDLLGIVAESSTAGLVMLAPGGLYEFLVLPFWLIAKGFQSPEEPTGALEPRPFESTT